MTTPTGPDLAKYSILELYSSGMRFCGDYDDDAAIQHYLELHPGVDEARVRHFPLCSRLSTNDSGAPRTKKPAMSRSLLIRER